MKKRPAAINREVGRAANLHIIGTKRRTRRSVAEEIKLGQECEAVEVASECGVAIIDVNA